MARLLLLVRGCLPSNAAKKKKSYGQERKKDEKNPGPIGSRKNLLLSSLREVAGNLSLNRFIGERLLAQCFEDIESEIQFLHGIAFQLRIQVAAVTTIGYLTTGDVTADFGDDGFLNSLLFQVVDKIVAQAVTTLFRLFGDVFAVEILEEDAKPSGITILGVVIHLRPELDRCALLVSAVEFPFCRILQNPELQENRMNRRRPYAALVFHSGPGFFRFDKLEAGNPVYEENIVGKKLAHLILAATAIKHNQRNPQLEGSPGIELVFPKKSEDFQ